MEYLMMLSVKNSVVVSLRAIIEKQLFMYVAFDHSISSSFPELKPLFSFDLFRPSL
jgi:hypothetical protein